MHLNIKVHSYLFPHCFLEQLRNFSYLDTIPFQTSLKDIIFNRKLHTQRMHRLVIAGLVLCVSASSLWAQDPVKTTRSLTKWERRFRRISVDDKIYQQGSNWFTAAGGVGYSTSLQKQEINTTLAYHFRYKPVYFRLGYHFSSDRFFLKRPDYFLNDFHTGAGLRVERNHFNFAFFIGPSWAYCYVEEPDEIGPVAYHALGALTEVQLTFKYFYDLGIGTSLYGSFNKHYQVIGLQLHLYFSGAYIRDY